MEAVVYVDSLAVNNILPSASTWVTTVISLSMIRLREQTYEDQFDDDIDAKKRTRLFGVEEETDSEGVISRCLSFLINLQHSSRPKTYEKLYRALQQICTFTFRVDSGVVCFHLILNHILIPHEQDGVKFVSVNPTPPPRPGNQFLVVVPNGSHSNRVSNDFKEALHKSAAWVQGNRGLQGKQIAAESFVRSLEQICTLKRKANPEVVIAHLLKRGMVRVDQDGCVVYDLPLTSPTGSHYMASICK